MSLNTRRRRYINKAFSKRVKCCYLLKNQTLPMHTVDKKKNICGHDGKTTMDEAYLRN